MFTRMLFVGSLLVAGCADDKGTTPDPEVGFVVSGTLSNENQIIVGDLGDIEFVNWHGVVA